MRATMDLSFDKKSLDKFKGNCNVAISKVGRGTKKATKASCEEILARSLEQVPQRTGNLASSAFYEVTGNYRTGFQGVVGYGGNGDPVSLDTGERASEYMIAVHEDLTAVHEKGNAKFLENPAKDFAKENFPRTVFKYVQESLEDMIGK